MGELSLGWDPWFDCPDVVVNTRCQSVKQETAGIQFFQKKKESSVAGSGWEIPWSCVLCLGKVSKVVVLNPCILLELKFILAEFILA